LCSLPSQPVFVLVCFILLGTCACIAGAWMTYLLDALQLPLSSPIAGAVVLTAAGSSSLDGGGAEPLSKRGCPWGLFPASTRYVCGAEFCGMSFPFPAFRILGFEGSVGLNDRRCTLLVPVIRWQSAVSVALAMEVPGVGGTPRGIVGTEMSGSSIPRSAAPGGAASAQGLGRPTSEVARTISARFF
jgi:hypothetical protein